MTTSVFQRKSYAAGLSIAMLAVLAACGGGDDRTLPIAMPEPVEQFVPPEPPSGYTPKAISYANRDMVSAANPLAVKAGVDILAKGGSATDAAIAVQLVLNLVEPQSSGIGGGAFMLHFDKAGNKLLAYDGRETAPMGATPDLFIGKDGKPLGFNLCKNQAHSPEKYSENLMWLNGELHLLPPVDFEHLRDGNWRVFDKFGAVDILFEIDDALIWYSIIISILY